MLELPVVRVDGNGGHRTALDAEREVAVAQVAHDVQEEHVRIRCDQTQADTDADFNRAEHLRLIPDNDPDWKPLMGRRQDSESGNRIVDDELPRERAFSDGALAQHWDLLGHMTLRNARALAMHERGSPPLALAA